MTLYEKIKNMSIEEMADYVMPLYNECNGCEYEKDYINSFGRCSQCTEEKQKSNIIRILNESV